MTLALYRKYRSGTFGALIGQEPISTTLRNEVVGGGVAHGYLFAGIRGTGKTSTARILARAVNCLDLKDGEPCNQCEACVRILNDSAVDVLEIDAASNRGIDEMRELREKVKYLPAILRRKIYIIDEAHMLTNEAWNALLKTLEEPPDHVMFILATTEAHKIPQTVQSRVQRFDFQRIGKEDIAAHLQWVCEQEKVTMPVEAMGIIARASRGSARDALSLLDQVLAGGASDITEERVRQALGLADPVLVNALIEAWAALEIADTLRICAQLFEAGTDARQLIRELARLCRGAEFCAVGYAQGADLSKDELEICQRLAKVAPASFWLQALEALTETEMALRQPVDARLQTELCLLRTVRNVKDVSSMPSVNSSGKVAVSEPTPLSNSSGVGQDYVSKQPIPAVSAPDPTASSNGTQTYQDRSPDSIELWQQRWPTLVGSINRRDSMLAGVLRDCKPIGVSGNIFIIGAPYSFHLDRLNDVLKQQLIIDSLRELSDKQYEIKIEFNGETKAAKDDKSAAVQDTTAQALEVFPGSKITGTKLKDVL